MPEVSALEARRLLNNCCAKTVVRLRMAKKICARKDLHTGRWCYDLDSINNYMQAGGQRKLGLTLSEIKTEVKRRLALG